MTFDEAYHYFGGGHGAKTKMAEAAGVRPQAVNNWRVKGEIPRSSQLEIQLYTKNKLKADKRK